MLIRDEIAYHHYEGVATDLDERERLVEDLGTKTAMILRNHGTLTVGETVGEAFIKMYFLERACEAQIHALAGGTQLINHPPQGTPEKAAEQGATGLKMVGNLLAWPALRRKMDRVDPSYQN
jgi:ribulose-5-phosphate 4-epimerase/fuculose-1-phosphate aldolase